MEVRRGVAQERRWDHGVRNGRARLLGPGLRDGRPGRTADPDLPRRAARVSLQREEVASYIWQGTAVLTTPHASQLVANGKVPGINSPRAFGFSPGYLACSVISDRSVAGH